VVLEGAFTSTFLARRIPVSLSSADSQKLQEAQRELGLANDRLKQVEKLISDVLGTKDPDSLSAAKSKAKKPKVGEDWHTIDNHEALLKRLKPLIERLRKETGKVGFDLELSKKHDSLQAILKAHEALINSGRALLKEEELIKHNLPAGSKSFYDKRGNYHNSSMVMISELLPDACRLYSQAAVRLGAK
jgi:Mg2+ and Co2+ transporter CorA